MIKLSINGCEVNHSSHSFSDGATGVKLISAVPVRPETALITVLSNGKVNEELFEVASIVSLLRDLRSNIRIDLYIPYTPYARQDRRMVRHDAFSLKVYANLLNSLNLSRVYVLDSHSGVAPALINNCVEIPQDFVLQELTNMYPRSENNLVIISPDLGAVKKASKAVDVFGAQGISYLNKVRDPATGQITKLSLFGGSEGLGIKGKNLLIVDDLCDGGGTFIQAAQYLNQFEPASIDLYVTHGIFSRNTPELRAAGIDLIFSTDSISATVNGVCDSGLSRFSCERIYNKWVGIER